MDTVEKGQQKNGTYLEKEELEMVQSMNSQFVKLKTSIGDIEITKHNMMKDLDSMREAFFINEKSLGEKYGSDAVINLSTGEVTRKIQ
jgi:hypothetical protein